mmetsp:Transcript_11680/g.27758  ORF Transcript_11680/g.27758 Transcript_11680/m.27758 type:complete len:206 (+) Transcript_11680:576-1193(+)
MNRCIQPLRTTSDSDVATEPARTAACALLSAGTSEDGSPSPCCSAQDLALSSASKYSRQYMSSFRSFLLGRPSATSDAGLACSSTCSSWSPPLIGSGSMSDRRWLPSSAQRSAPQLRSRLRQTELMCRTAAPSISSPYVSHLVAETFLAGPPARDERTLAANASTSRCISSSPSAPTTPLMRKQSRETSNTEAQSSSASWSMLSR